jgi:uncharacterized protein
MLNSHEIIFGSVRHIFRPIDEAMRPVYSSAVFIHLLALVSCGRSGENPRTELVFNKLGNSGSPYLRQHADNPVQWYEWGPEALEKAKAENKPLIISIGYASCHWCHVMERESFMDTAVARLMNKYFVSIKIDREERPDIDQIYLNAAELISGNAGWPLNAFALPDGKPFYAATYFPKGQWIAILQQIADSYKNDQYNLIKQANKLTEGIQTSGIISFKADSAESFDEMSYKEIYRKWEDYFDDSKGGLMGEPKFPMPAVWEYLLQDHHLTGNEKSLRLVETTLNEMLKGGIYDQLAGGFSRYATDENWKVPHFEKMLYDNGQLVSVYAHAYQVTRNPAYAEVVENTLEFIKTQLTSSAGGFYSSLNADSEGVEGKFYVWTKKEIENLLTREEADLLTTFYQVTEEGNWEAGKNILHSKILKGEFKTGDLTTGDANKKLLIARRKLLAARNERVHPSLDDKILVSWNALMMKGYLDAFFALGNPEYLNAALTNARFLEDNMLNDDGHLFRNFLKGKVSVDAFLDDYALLARAFILLYQATFDLHWLDQARLLTEYVIRNFRDDDSGLFFYTSNTGESLAVRKTEVVDNVIPSSNSVLAEVLFLLGEYYDVESYKKMSTFMLHQVVDEMLTDGPFYANWARLRGLVTYQPFEVVVIGPDAKKKSRQILQHYFPLAVFMGGVNENLPLMESKLVGDRTIIYVCRNKTCKLPEESVEKALVQLKVR